MTTKRERIEECIHETVEAERIGREYLVSTGMMDDWREALLTWLSQGELTNPDGFNLKANRLMSDMMTLVPRFLKYLVSTEPYFPLGPQNTRDQTARFAARNWEDVLNEMMRRAGIYGQMNDVVTFLTLYGFAGMEVRMDLSVVNTYEQQPVIDKTSGMVIGYQKTPAQVVNRNLRCTPRAPWEMLFHPHRNTLNEKKWSLVKDICDVEEIRRLLDMKVFELPNGYTDEDLDKPPQESAHGEDPEKSWRRDRSIYSDEAGENLGVLIRKYDNPSRDYPNGKWVYLWNYHVPLMKDGYTENQLEYVGKDVKPFVVFRDISPPRPDRFYGQGLYRALKDLIRHRDDLLSVALDRLYMSSYGWWVYDPRAIEPEHMKRASYGARVPLKQTFDKTVGDALYHVPGTDPPSSIFQMQDFIDRLSDERVGLPYPMTGEVPPRKEAATTNSILANAGDQRLEAQIRLVELSSMSDLGELASCMLAKGLMPKQIIDIIGIDRYMQAPVDSLHSVTGGYVWRFRGSSMVIRNTAKREALKDAWSMVGADPAVMRGDRTIVLREILSTADAGLTDDQVSRIVPTPEEPPILPVEMQQQLAQQGVQTQEQQFGIVGAQRPGATNEQSSRALARIMGE